MWDSEDCRVGKNVEWKLPSKWTDQKVLQAMSLEILCIAVVTLTCILSWRIWKHVQIQFRWAKWQQRFGLFGCSFLSARCILRWGGQSAMVFLAFRFEFLPQQQKRRSKSQIARFLQCVLWPRIRTDASQHVEFYHHFLQFFPIRLPPGPTGLPYIGVARQLKPADMVSRLQKWKDQFGDIYSFTLPSQRVVVVRACSVLRCVPYVQASFEILANQTNDHTRHDVRLSNCLPGNLYPVFEAENPWLEPSGIFSEKCLVFTENRWIHVNQISMRRTRNRKILRNFENISKVHFCRELCWI